jgi:CubicO group peptidase (beta-lactamase class C family)
MPPARILLACFLVVLAFPAVAAPDEDLLGKARGYPLGTRANWFYDESVRVGSFSHLDQILPHYTLKKPASPLRLAAASGDATLGYSFENKAWTLEDFLAHQRITGLLVIKDGAILFERYQYDRKPSDRLISHSMAKSIVSLAVSMAVAEGKIASLDDLVSKYVPKLAGSLYGETTIRNVLRMSSGVEFKEVYDGNDDLTRFSIVRNREGTIAALREFKTREAEQGTRFHYASSETVILAVLLRAVTGTTLSEYLTARLWQPIGAEADATWVKTADGTETGS